MPVDYLTITTFRSWIHTHTYTTHTHNDTHRYRDPMSHDDVINLEENDNIPDAPLSGHDPHELHHLGTCSDRQTDRDRQRMKETERKNESEHLLRDDINIIKLITIEYRDNTNNTYRLPFNLCPWCRRGRGGGKADGKCACGVLGDDAARDSSEESRACKGDVGQKMQQTDLHELCER